MSGAERCSRLDPLFDGDVSWSVLARRADQGRDRVRASCSSSVMLYIWGMRKVIADMQNRIGPNRAGPYGVLQTLADGIKLFFKEQSIPTSADRPVFRLAPYLSILPAFLMFCVVPIGGTVSILGHKTYLQVADLPIGALFILAMSGLGVYGVMLAGWSSGSKYPLLGAVRVDRAAALVRSRVRARDPRRADPGAARSRRTTIVDAAGVGRTAARSSPTGSGCRTLVPFVIFLIAATAETNHPPFDLVEAEQELVGGFNTEYTGIRFAIFFLAEFMNVITMSAIAVTLFLGGPSGPSLGFLVERQRRQRVGHADLLVHREGARAAVRDGVAARVVAAHALRPADGARLEVPHRDRDPLGARVDRARRRTRRGLEPGRRGAGRGRRSRSSRSSCCTSRCPKPGEHVEEFH